MTFTRKFDSYVCIGDSIECEIDDYIITARIVHDDVSGPPDKMCDGFWPSLYRDDPGFIGSGNGWRDRFDKAQAHAETVMAAWQNDDWFYCGIVLSVAIGETALTDHAASLWAIEANYPDSDNSYLTDVADELLPEALAEAQTLRAKICRGVA